MSSRKIVTGIGISIPFYKKTSSTEEISNVVYQGTLTPQYQDEEDPEKPEDESWKHIIGYSKWPEDPEFGIYGSIDPLDKNILHLGYHNEIVYPDYGAIMLIGYHVTKLTIGDIDYVGGVQVGDPEDVGTGNMGTIFTYEGIINPFTENVSVNIILIKD